MTVIYYYYYYYCYYVDGVMVVIAFFGGLMLVALEVLWDLFAGAMLLLFVLKEWESSVLCTWACLVP